MQTNKIIKTKYCNICRRTKPLKEFSLLKSGKYFNYCKECCRAKSKKWYKANKERKDEWQLKYYYQNKDLILTVRKEDRAKKLNKKELDKEIADTIKKLEILNKEKDERN